MPADNSIGVGTLGRGHWAGLTPQLQSARSLPPSAVTAQGTGKVITTPIAARRLELRLTLLVGGGPGGGAHGSLSVLVSGPTAKGGDASLRSLPITRSLADEPVQWQQPQEQQQQEGLAAGGGASGRGDGLNATRLPLLWQGELLALAFTLVGNVTLFAFSL